MQTSKTDIKVLKSGCQKANKARILFIDLCDADRYANLNTILGYDVGVQKFRSLDNWLWIHNFDLMELNGSNKDKELLKRATKETKTKDLDFSKWSNMESVGYVYAYYENGNRYE